MKTLWLYFEKKKELYFEHFVFNSQESEISLIFILWILSLLFLLLWLYIFTFVCSIKRVY